MVVDVKCKMHNSEAINISSIIYMVKNEVIYCDFKIVTLHRPYNLAGRASKRDRTQREHKREGSEPLPAGSTTFLTDSKAPLPPPSKNGKMVK